MKNDRIIYYAEAIKQGRKKSAQVLLSLKSPSPITNYCHQMLK